MLESILIVVLVAVLFLLAFVLVRTILFGHAPAIVEAVELEPVDGSVVAEHLAAAIRYRTISDGNREKIDNQPFLELRKELERMYPRVHSTLHLDTVNRYSLFYTWKGKNEALEPILLAGHMDVVPIDPATRDEWKYEPFGGQIAEGHVWGRGALDTKCTVITMFEAVEALIKSGYQPERTVLLAIGHDEEISGLQGASQMAGRIQAYNSRLAAVIDEGSFIFKPGVIPGVSLPVALVGVSEKGHLTLRMQVEGSGGHAAFPPQHSAIGVLAQAITKLENAPMKARDAMARQMFGELGPYLPFGLRAAFANMWLLGPIVRKQFENNGRTNAFIHTTTAVTLVNGGVKDNVLPSRAEAAVNFRLMPGDRIADVVAHARKVINNEAVQFNIPEGHCWEASPVSPTDSPAYMGLTQAIGQVFPEAITAPYLVLAATDSRYYTSVCDQVYRFGPVIAGDEEISTVHGVNERIPVEGLGRMVQFYAQLIKTWGKD
jgi:carboxypeptidase PM20D1